MTSIKINRSRKISEIKDEFNDAFPFLKLEFFKADHKVNEANSKKEMIRGNPELSDLQTTTKDSVLDIAPSMTVSTLEMTFRDRLGLNVQVFRKSGKVWLETSSTDHMSLSGQNELGKEKSIAPGKEDLTDIDYD